MSVNTGLNREGAGLVCCLIVFADLGRPSYALSSSEE